MTEVDLLILNRIFYYRTDFWDHFFWAFTWLGNWQVIAVLSILTSLVFWFIRKRSMIKPFLVSVFGSGLTTILLKFIFDRERPSADLASYTEKLPAFPSAHSALICTWCGFLIYSLWRFSNFNKKCKIFLSLILLLIIALVGFSRLYLGVHFPSDVLGGYLVGFGWVLIGIWLTYHRF